jgi:hypothetical protein
MSNEWPAWQGPDNGIAQLNKSEYELARRCVNAQFAHDEGPAEDSPPVKPPGITPANEQDRITASGDRIRWERDGQLVVERPFYGAEKVLLQQRDAAQADARPIPRPLVIDVHSYGPEQLAEIRRLIMQDHGKIEPARISAVAPIEAMSDDDLWHIAGVVEQLSGGSLFNVSQDECVTAIRASFMDPDAGRAFMVSRAKGRP